MESESIIKFRIARNILAFYQLCGMLLITFPRKSQIEKFLKCLGIFHLLFLFVSLAISLYYFDYLFDARNPLGLFMDVIQLAIPIGTNFVILLQSISSRELHRKIWQLYVNLENILRTHDILIEQKLRRFLVRYILKLIILVSIGCGVELVIIGIISETSEGWRRQRVLALVPFLGHRLCQLMLMFYIELYREFFEIIIEETNNAVSLSRDTLQKPVKQFILYRKCKCLKNSLNTLWLIIKYINKSFGYSIFVNITMNFIILIVHYYWNFKALFLNTSSNPTASLLCSIPLVAVLLPFIQSCDASIRPFRQIKHLIGKIQLQSDNRQFNRFIKQFSLQMLQYSIQLDASGFFSINFELLQAVSVNYFKGKVTQTVKLLPSLSIYLYRNAFRD